MAEISWPWQYNFPPFFTYLNEGNVHIVVELIDTGYVLRFIKEDGKSITVDDIEQSQSFINLVMLPLLTKNFTIKNEIVMVQTDVLNQLCIELLPLRPETRRHKYLLSNFAIKTPNLALLSPKCEVNYCIEIKPKEGFMSSSLVDMGKCYFCLKQYVKLHRSHIKDISNYCPLDLFSGEKNRMKHALLSLLDSPQNNFKLFKDGNLIYHDQSKRADIYEIVKNMECFKTFDSFLEFLIAILLNDNASTIIALENNNAEPPPRTSKCNKNTKLNNKSFLYKLLQLQKLSETVAIDTMSIKSNDFEYLPVLFEEIKTCTLNLSDDNGKERFFKITHPLHLAMIAAVARDCSIMISFSPIKNEAFPFIQIGDIRIPYKLSVTDLEPKSIQSLITRKKAELKMREIYKIYDEKDQQIQPHTETRAKQLEAWQQLISEYLRANKQSTIDIRESLNSPLFNNSAINRKLSQDSILTILDHMAKTGRAMPVDKSRNVWEVYWHSLDEWGNMIYNWASSNGLNNSVCTLFELREGDNTTDEEFHGLDMNVLIKALKSLSARGKCELIEFDDNQGVKFF